MIQDQKERRRFTRVSIQIEGELALDDATTISGISRDLSLNGVFLLCDASASVDANCHVTLFLGERTAPLRVEAHGRVVRTDETGVGLTFTDIMGIESFEHLRNLVLYNANTYTEQVEEEFGRYHGIRVPA